MPVPNAFIVGVNKAGTTAVFNSLSRQPNVCVSSRKETHFFDPLKYGRKIGDLAEYEEYFQPSPTDTTILEATPGYFYGGHRVAEKIRSISPHSKALVILREPGARAFSWWRFCKTRLLLPQDLDFETYLDRCEVRGIEPESDDGAVPWRGLSGGHYDAWLPEWQQVFGDDLLVMYADHFRSSPKSSLNAVGRHFGIDVVNFAGGEDNVSVDIRYPLIQRAALKLNDAGERFWRTRPRLKRTLLSTYYRINGRRQQDSMTATSRARLNAHFEAPLSRLRSQLDDVPPSWGV